MWYASLTPSSCVRNHSRCCASDSAILPSRGASGIGGRTAVYTAVLPPIPLTPRDGRIALSLAQQRLWFLTQLEGVSEAYHMSGAVRLDGPLNRVVSG